jgi:sugar-specific transcriptional regulator TrmB
MQTIAEQVSEALQAMGFSTNESRAYVALVQGSPSTGYELAQRTRIPRSAIYGVLRRLQDAGLAVQTSEKPARFAPLPPEALFRMLRRRFDNGLERLQEQIQQLGPPVATSELWHIRGYAALLQEAARFAGKAERTLWLSLWRREAARLREPVVAAAQRGVQVVVFSFCDVSELAQAGGARVYHYGLPEEELETFWHHKVVAIADGERVLLGDAEESAGAISIETDNAQIAELATTQVVMDLTLLGRRLGVPVGDTVAGMSGPRLGRLDEVLARHAGRGGHAGGAL